MPSELKPLFLLGRHLDGDQESKIVTVAHRFSGVAGFDKLIDLGNEATAPASLQSEYH